MTDFYVQVKSNASTDEFPDNASNKFKNRLPYVLLFRELGWKVGLSNITFPVSNKTVRTVSQKRMALKNPFLFQFDWYEVWNEGDMEDSRYYLEIYENNVSFPSYHSGNAGYLPRIPRSGTELMTDIRNHPILLSCTKALFQDARSSPQTLLRSNQVDSFS